MTTTSPERNWTMTTMMVVCDCDSVSDGNQGCGLWLTCRSMQLPIEIRHTLTLAELLLSSEDSSSWRMREDEEKRLCHSLCRPIPDSPDTLWNSCMRIKFRVQILKSLHNIHTHTCLYNCCYGDLKTTQKSQYPFFLISQCYGFDLFQAHKTSPHLVSCRQKGVL